ncbi:MAG: branched-chain amino acid aminotransferase [Microscillaceae bacterium]|nr:branched-chain amino acid aminotransferase [Microscillaceae bacterium]MDW8461849.1 branched-chain amino acid aminotransferase [Cytophagales bacterium]
MVETTQFEVQKVAQSHITQVDFDNLPFGRIFADHMLVAYYAQGQWQEVRIQPYSPLPIYPSLSALHYGQSIFEGMKAYRTVQDEIVIFRPYDNFERMNRSAERMCMPAIPEELFIGGILQLVQLDQAWVSGKPGNSLYIRPFMFGADNAIGIRPSETYYFIIFCCPVSSYYSEPVKVKIEQHYVRAVEGGTGYAKTAGNYAASLYPAQLAQKQGYHQLIWTDGKEHKYIEESGTMNVMFIIDEKLITASLGDTVLDGVTRKSVLHLAREWGYIVEERKVTVAEVVTALENNTLQEAFGVGTAAVISPIQLIAYEGTDYPVPLPTEKSFSNRAKKYLDDLKRGRIADEYGWLLKVC